MKLAFSFTKVYLTLPHKGDKGCLFILLSCGRKKKNVCVAGRIILKYAPTDTSAVTHVKTMCVSVISTTEIFDEFHRVSYGAAALTSLHRNCQCHVTGSALISILRVTCLTLFESLMYKMNAVDSLLQRRFFRDGNVFLGGAYHTSC